MCLGVYLGLRNHKELKIAETLRCVIGREILPEYSHNYVEIM
jgi:hypothetical protein